MDQIRRVQLTPILCNLANSITGENLTLLTHSDPSIPVEENYSEFDKTKATMRCVLTLFEPDECDFPEFSYAEVVDKKSGHIVKKDGTPQENENHGELVSVARKFEKKYAGVKRRKMDRIQDLVDIGFGYDDEDSFIDNSEAYDELVPASLTTKYGGFYINSGVLQFRQASDTETEDFTINRKIRKPPKKRKLHGQDLPKKQSKEDGRVKVRRDVKKSDSLENRVEKKKKKKSASPLSVTNMLKKFRKEKEREMQKRETERQCIGTPRFALCPADAAGGGGSGADPLLSLIGSTNVQALIQAATTVDFDIDLDSLLDATEDNSQLKSAQHTAEMQPIIPSQASTDVRNQLPVLFQSQPQSEIKSCLVPQLRKVGELKVDPIEKLKEAIGRAMPEQLARFHDNRQAHAQVKSTKVMEEKKTREQRVNAGSEDEGEERIGKRGPQKKFKWNEEIRSEECLCLVVKAKMDGYETENGDSQEMEDYLKNFLDNEVKILWPKGWMQPRVLLKESKKILGLSSFLKKAKSEKKLASISDASLFQDGAADCTNGHLLCDHSTEEVILSLATDKTLKEGVIADVCPLVSVLEGEGLDSEPTTVLETARKPLCATVPVAASSTQSLLDLLAEQAVARGHVVNASISQKLKAAAISSANGQHSAHHWTLGALKSCTSPSPPPPAPQSSPVDFPGNCLCKPFEPPAQLAHFPAHENATRKQAVTDG